MGTATRDEIVRLLAMNMRPLSRVERREYRDVIVIEPFSEAVRAARDMLEGIEKAGYRIVSDAQTCEQRITPEPSVSQGSCDD